MARNLADGGATPVRRPAAPPPPTPTPSRPRPTMSSQAAARLNPAVAARVQQAGQARNTAITNQNNQRAWAGESVPTSPSSSLPSTATANIDPMNLMGIQRIMQQSGSTDPSDPYNWKAIAAALGGGGAPQQSTFVGGGDDGGFGGGSSYTPPSQVAAAPPPVIEAPSAITTPQVQPPTSITGTGTGVVGAPTGLTFQSTGNTGTFGSFDRMRNQRSPRSGLSVTPELLRRQAQARLR